MLSIAETARTNIIPMIIFFVVNLGGKLGSFSSKVITSSFNSPTVIPRIKSPTVNSLRNTVDFSFEGKYLVKLKDEMLTLNCLE